MDFGFTEEQRMLREALRDVLQKEYPTDLVRKLEKDDIGYSKEFWNRIADLGWLGIALPERYGGAGCGFVDLTIILEEMGKSLVAGPFVSTVVQSALAIVEAGSDEMKQQFLPKIARGDLVLALCLTEPTGRFDAAGITMKAAPDRDGYMINGTKLFVPYAHVSDYLLCVARTQEASVSEQGISLFLVAAKDTTRSVLQTVGLDKQSRVVFDNVHVPISNILGKFNYGWPIVEKIIQRAAVAECALMVGEAQCVLEMTSNYAKQREQFGRPIGSFQAIQHRCADMLFDVDGARLITYEAAWMLSKDLPCRLQVSMAKAWVSEAYHRICRSAHQVHGGVGFMEDHILPLYFRQSKVQQLMFGDAAFHREIVAQELDLS